MTRAILLPLMALSSLACSPGPTGGSDRHQPAVKPGCRVTACLAGAITREDGANPAFGELCARLPGVLEDCDDGSGRCYPMFDIFSTDAALEAVVAALDEDGDGAVGGADRACDVAIVGYSWGGINAAQLAARLVGDPRLSPARRRVAALVAIDPFAPVAALNVPEGVEAFWGYRHSASPATDCSRNAPLGPYRGVAPACHASVRCLDHDYSLAPASASFSGLAAADVGHCSIVRAAGPAVIDNVETRADHPAAPPRVAVQTFGETTP